MTVEIKMISGTCEGDSPEKKFERVGMVSWLWYSSKLHLNWRLRIMMNSTVPAIETGQYALLLADGFPVAYCAWAYMDRAAERRYLDDPNAMQLADWTSGDRMWFIDWLAPFGHNALMYKEMCGAYHQDAIARSLRVKQGKSVARVFEFRGRNITAAAARKKFDEYLEDFKLMAAERATANAAEPAAQ